MPRGKKGTGAADYAAYKAGQAAISRERSAAGREIGPLPAVADPARRNACLSDFRMFCETYLANRFTLAWSADHLTAIGRIETAVIGGGRFAFAMPRGSGKTSLCEAAALWAVVYGLRSFVVMIGATAEAAAELLDSVKVEVEANDLLAEDFPEVCHPVRCLEGQNNRANGQTLGGVRTRITWTDDEIALPTVAGSACSGSLVRVAGITGRIRGMKAATADGRSIRPDLVVIDDPQTDESSASPTQNAKRERLLSGAVLGLAGPKVKIAAVMPCTVIHPRDMADRILSRDDHPEWNGERMKLVYSFPANQPLWDRYAEERVNGLRAGRGLADATAFYAANRAAMDAGAAVAWEQRFNPDELSAVQYAMNLMLSDRRAFLAEYQNEPEADDLGAGAKQLAAEAVAGRVGGVPRFEVPPDCNRLTAFVDCHASLLWYAVVGWSDQFGGGVVDYGVWPRQTRAVFTNDDPRPGLRDQFPGHTDAQLVFAGLAALTPEILGRDYFRKDGSALKVERCLVDAGWQPDAVARFVRQSPFAAVLTASKGIARTTTAAGVAAWKPRPGERRGHHWRLTAGEGGKGRLLQFDPDAWKDAVYDLLAVPLGGRSTLTLFGTSAGPHALFGEACAAEYGHPVESRGSRWTKWEVKPGRPDNHWWDCLVGSAVAAAYTGAQLPLAGAGLPAAGGLAKPASRVKLSEVLAAKRAAAGRG